MDRNFSSSSLVNENKITLTVDLPRICPNCDHAIDAHIAESSYYVEKHGFARIGIIYFCHHCERYFFGTYVDHDFNSYNSYLYNEQILPIPQTVDSFTEKIINLSPSFVEIYHQAQSAENQGLTQICGMGYRKALEFLIKDYAIHLHPDEANDIKSKMLSPCIKEYIDSPKIKSLATASAWIGNDETHYVRKQEDYDISDLKAFIRAAVAFIDADLAVEDAETLLLSKK